MTEKDISKIINHLDDISNVSVTYAKLIAEYPNCLAEAMLCATIEMYCEIKNINPLAVWEDMYNMAIKVNS